MSRGEEDGDRARKTLWYVCHILSVLFELAFEEIHWWVFILRGNIFADLQGKMSCKGSPGEITPSKRKVLLRKPYAPSALGEGAMFGWCGGFCDKCLVIINKNKKASV